MADAEPYRPAAQSTHTLAPAREYFPAGHANAVGLVDPAAHTYPPLQLPEHPDDDTPDTDPYKPAAHGAVHDATPMFAVAPYSPAAQSVQVPAPPTEYLPAGQPTAVPLTDAEGHAYPALQLPEHPDDDTPDVDPYRPAAQSLQYPSPVTEYFPAGHAEAVGLVDPGPHAYPPLHGPLHPDDVRPVVDPYRPWAHGPLHDADDSADVPPY